MKVTTNNVPRDIIDACELTAAERSEFELDWGALERGEDSASFVRCDGRVINLADFSADYGITRGAGAPEELAGWDAYLDESFVYALVIRYVGDGQVIIGRVSA